MDFPTIGIHWCVLVVFSVLCAAYRCRPRKKRWGAPVPKATTRLAQDLTREVLERHPVMPRRPAPMIEDRLSSALDTHFRRLLPHRLKGLRPPLVLPLEEARWPALDTGAHGEPVFQGQNVADYVDVPFGKDARELCQRVLEISRACKNPSMHDKLDGLSIHLMVESHIANVWFCEAPQVPVPFVASEARIDTRLPLEAVLWSIYSPPDRLKWDRSPFVKHERICSGGVQMSSRARRDFIYSRVSIAFGVSDRDVVQERFLMQLPDEEGYAILTSSCSEEVAATLGRKPSTAVRSRDLLSAYLFRPCPQGILLFTLSQKDAGSHVPAMFQAMARNAGKRKPLEAAEQLGEYCRHLAGAEK